MLARFILSSSTFRNNSCNSILSRVSWTLSRHHWAWATWSAGLGSLSFLYRLQTSLSFLLMLSGFAARPLARCPAIMGYVCISCLTPITLRGGGPSCLLALIISYGGEGWATRGFVIRIVVSILARFLSCILFMYFTRLVVISLMFFISIAYLN